MIEKDVERGLQLMSGWHMENYGARLIAVPAWAEANPRHAAEFTWERAAHRTHAVYLETLHA